MVDQEQGSTRPVVDNRPASSQRSGTNSSDEPVSAFNRPDCQTVGAASSYQGHGGSYAPYYGHGSVGYPDFADRFSMGYQRMGQTITLTSHKIQFGCQGHAHHAFVGPRCDGSALRHQYHMLPPAGKPWLESCPDRQQNNSKTNNRGRTTYSDDQIAELESVFNNNPYPTSQTRQRLAYKIDVPEGKVKIWFQNRRARAKKSKLACAGSWRPSHSDSRSADERANHNNNNVKEPSSKGTSVDSTLPMGSILPLPTKASISTSGWSSHMHPWSACYEDSSRNSSRLDKTVSQNAGCAMRGNCICHDSISRYPSKIMQGMDRCTAAPTLTLPTSTTYAPHENVPPYIVSELSSPPPIRRLIYPFHTLVENGIKPERKTEENQFPLQSESMSEYGNAGGGNFSNYSAFPPCPYAKPADSFSGYQGNNSNTYTQMQRAEEKWNASEDVGRISHVPDNRNNSESNFDRGIVERPSLTHSSGQLDDEEDVPTDDAIDERGMMECLKNDNGTESENKMLAFEAVEPATLSNGFWINRASSNILVKAMEYAEGDAFSEKRSVDERNVVSRLASMNTSGAQSADPSTMWPNQFSGNLYPSASASMVG